MNAIAEQFEHLNTNTLVRGVIGGLVGTVAFTLMGLYGAPDIIGQTMDVADLLAPALGGSHTLGMIAHFGAGTFIFPAAYLMFGLPALPGPAWLRGALFLIFVYLTAMLFVMPVLGHGLFLGSLPKAVVALMGHLVHGVIMGQIIGIPDHE